MQGRVREGGDHLAAKTNHSKGHTSFFRASARFRRNRLESTVLRAGSRTGAAESRFPLFPILPASEGRDRRDVCAFARALVRIRNGGGPGGGSREAAEPRRNLLTTCKYHIKNNIYLKTTIPAGRGLTTLAPV
jgi:hypothetical protein